MSQTIVGIMETFYEKIVFARNENHCLPFSILIYYIIFDLQKSFLNQMKNKIVGNLSVCGWQNIRM